MARVASRTVFKVTPRSSARWLALWITGPSARGSENGTPSSSTSAPPLSSSRAAATVRSSEGSPAVRKATNALRLSLRSWAKRSPIRVLMAGSTASTSISTSMSGSMRRVTSTMVAAGRMSRKISPWARPTSSHFEMSVTKVRVRTTSRIEAPALSSARATFLKIWTVWA